MVSKKEKHSSYCTCLLCFAKEVGPIVVIGLVVVTILIGGGGYVATAIQRHIDFPAQVQRIEQVRRDLATVEAGDRAHLIEQAVMWNQAIVECRYWNIKWYADALYHDGCNTLEPIRVSR